MTYLPIKRHISVEINSQISNETFHNLQMYNVSPSGYIILEELEQWCVDRLRVLELVEEVSKQNYGKTARQCIVILIEELQEKGLCNFVRLLSMSTYDTCDEDKTLRRNDCVSHFMLRSILSFEIEKRQWFFNQEVKLFKWRYSLLNQEELQTFIKLNRLHFVCISEEEKQSIKAYLERSSYDINNVDKLAFYKVCFTLVSKLIRKRQVFLKMGIAYVPETRLSSIIFFEFKRSLSEGFAYSRHIASYVYNDQRLIKLFNVLQNSVHIQDFNYAGSRKISIDELDELSKISYPLCMKVLHEALRTKHHLTNGGRVQYCLFLKGIGLDLNDALKFWTDEFTKIIDENTFDKNYKYNIRHLYGQEGRRADYTPFDCSKIMNSIISPRDNHGCPFKYMTADLLNETLSKAGVVQSDVEAIMKFSEKHYYLLACKMYYEVTHECVTDDIIDHPNLYFNNSRNKFEGPHSPEAPTCNDEIVIVHEQESQNG